MFTHMNVYSTNVLECRMHQCLQCPVSFALLFERKYLIQTVIQASDICKHHTALLCHWHKDRRSFPVCLRQAELRAHWQMKGTPSGTGLHVHLRDKRMKRGNALTCHTASAPGTHPKWVSELEDRGSEIDLI